MINQIDHNNLSINWKGKTMREENIFNACVEKLRKLPPVKSVKKRKSSKVKNVEVDVSLDISTDRGDIRFVVEVKGVLKRPIPRHLAVMKNRLNLPFLLMSEYVNPSIAEDLKQNGIHFIDCQGNAYIDVNEYIYINVQGRKKEHTSEQKTTTLFQPTGMRLLFVLLAYPDRLNTTLRELKNLAGISFGQTQAGMKELKAKELVFKNKKGKLKFLDKKSLLEKWLEYYADRLRPKLILGSYKVAPSIESEISQKLNDLLKGEQDSYATGGSLGADHLLRYYRGPSTEIFIRPELLYKVQSELKLMEAKETNMTLFNLFSPLIIYKANTPFSVAHPLFLYAELLHQSVSRAHETAELIYNTYLRSLIDEA